MSKNTILVLGGAGYIGAHCCKELQRNGFEPIVYDNLVNGHADFVKWGPFIQGDLQDKHKLNSVFKKFKPIAVMHFSAFAYVGESVEQPLKYYKNNVGDTIILLEAMLENGITKLIFSSTCATYGNPQELPITELHPQNPINPYGRSKLYVEQILQDFSQSYGLHFVIFRYFNAAGADPDGEIGEKHEPETHLIPILLDVALGQRPYFVVNGKDYQTPDGTCIRDFVHVSDIAKAHVLGLEWLLSNHKSNFYNLANNNGYSILDVLRCVEQVCEKKLPVKFGVPRPGDPSILIGDASKARDELLWEPNYSDIATIVETAWHWHKKMRNIQD